MMSEKKVLSNNKDFDKVYNRGKRVFDRYVVIFCLKNGLDHERVSCVASKKVGNSVRRNRARRLMRESLRLLNIDLSGYDVVIVAKNSINDKKLAEVKKSMESALKKLKILKENKGGGDGHHKIHRKADQ